MTSALLSLVPDDVLSATKIDTYFPTKGFKRYVATDDTYVGLFGARERQKWGQLGQNASLEQTSPTPDNASGTTHSRATFDTYSIATQV